MSEDRYAVSLEGYTKALQRAAREYTEATRVKLRLEGEYGEATRVYEDAQKRLINLRTALTTFVEAVQNTNARLWAGVEGSRDDG